MAKASVLDEISNDLAKDVVDVILTDSGQQKKCKELCQSLVSLLEQKPHCASVVADAFRGHKQNNYLRVPLQKLKAWNGPEDTSLDNMPWKALQKQLEKCSGSVDDLKDFITNRNDEPVLLLQKVVGNLFQTTHPKQKLTQIWKRSGYTTPCPPIEGLFQSKNGPLANTAGLAAFANELYPCEFTQHKDMLERLARRLSDVPTELRSKHGEMVLEATHVPIIHLDNEPWFCVTRMIEAMGYSAARNYVCMELLSYARKIGLKIEGDLARTAYDNAVESVEGTKHFDEDVEQYEKDIAARSKGLKWMSCPYNNGKPVLFGDFHVLVLLLNRLKTRKARQFRAAALEQSMLVMSGSVRVATSLAQYWCEQRMSKPDNILLQYLGAVGEYMEAQHPVPQTSTEENLKHEIEMDILRSKQRAQKLLAEQEEERTKQEQERTEQERERTKQERERTKTVTCVETKKRESECKMIDIEMKRRRVEITYGNRSQNPELTRDFESAEADSRGEIHLSDILKKYLVINALNLQSAVSTMAKIAPIAVNMETVRRPELTLGVRTSYYIDANGAARQNSEEKDYREDHLPALVACMHVMVTRKKFVWKDGTPANLSEFWLENVKYLA